MFVLQTHIFYSAKKQHADKEKSHARDVPTVRLQKRKNIMDQKYSVEVPDLGIQISTGSIAKQANGSVTISMGETNLLVTATAAGALRDGQDFFPSRWTTAKPSPPPEKSLEAISNAKAAPTKKKF